MFNILEYKLSITLFGRKKESTLFFLSLLTSLIGKIFNYHWLSIDGPEAGFLFKALGYKPGIIEAGNPPENLFSSLELYLQNNIKEYQIKALDTASNSYFSIYS